MIEVMETTTKMCARCPAGTPPKSLSEFCKGNGTHGRHPWCRACVAAKKREDRRNPETRARVLEAGRRERASPSRKCWQLQRVLSGENAERAKKYYHANYEKNREKILGRQSERRRTPEGRHKQKCNALVGLLIYFGEIQRGPCTICASTVAIEAAHRSYSDPLDFFWACPRHHRQYDRGIIDEKGALLISLETGRRRARRRLVDGDTNGSF